MVKYILVSSKFEGFLVYGYNKLGYLVHFQNCSWGMNEEQLTSVCMNLKYALSHDNFKLWVANCGHRIINRNNDLSFEHFWRVFDNARNRIQSERLWKPLNDEMKQYAFHVHEAYLYYLEQNPWVTKMYPDTFLRTHLRDEWFKTKPPEKKK